jgi:hypothetical protein
MLDNRRDPRDGVAVPVGEGSERHALQRPALVQQPTHLIDDSPGIGSD